MTIRVFSGAISPDGTVAATAGGDSNEIYLWKTGGRLVLASPGRQGTADLVRRLEPGRQVDRLGQHIQGHLVQRQRAPSSGASRWRTSNSAHRPTPATGGLESPAARSPSSAPGRPPSRSSSRTPWRRRLPARSLRVDPQLQLRDGRPRRGGGDYGLYLFDARTGAKIREFRGHTGDRLGRRSLARRAVPAVGLGRPDRADLGPRPRRAAALPLRRRRRLDRLDARRATTPPAPAART